MKKWRIRAAQVDLARQLETPGFLRSFLDFLARHHFNTLFLYLEGRIPTATFPLPPAAESVSPDLAREIVARAARMGIDVVPVVSNLDHAEQFLRHPRLAHLAELREGVPGRFDDERSALCPSLDETYRFFESYFADIARLFPSQYFHVGCDECRDLGSCPLCRERARREGEHSIFTKHLLRTHRFLSEKLNRRMMIWDDMFETCPETLPALPRDIIMCGWFYNPVFETPRSHFFNLRAFDAFRDYDRLGFEYLVCPREQSLLNVLSCTDYARRHRPLGGLVTSWEKSDGFLYRYLPVIGFAGLLWSGCGEGPTLLKKACRNLFADDSAELAESIDLYSRRGPRSRPPAAGGPFISSPPAPREETRNSENRLLSATLGKIRLSRAGTTGRRVLADIRADIALEMVLHDLRTAVPRHYRSLFEAVPGPAPARAIEKGACRLEKLAAGRATHWERWRPGILPDTASPVLLACAGSHRALARAPAPAALVMVHGFLPDYYSAPLSAILLFDEDRDTWREIFSGSLKPPEEETWYTISIPVRQAGNFSRARLETRHYGAQGFRYLEIRTREGILVPAALESVRGLVSEPEHLLADDYRWVYLGFRDVLETYRDRRKAREKHSLTVSLRPAGRPAPSGQKQEG